MLASCAAIASAEKGFFADRSAEPWMDEAGRLCAAAVLDFFPKPARAVVFVGKGNNGGDALVVARWLKRAGWEVSTRLAGDLGELPAKKWREFEQEAVPERVPRATRLLIIDGLVGIGAKGELRGRIGELAAEANALRLAERGTTFAIDLPSGLDADTGIAGPDAIVADFTLSITLPKPGFVSDAAVNHVGRLVEIPLDIPVDDIDATRSVLFPSNLRKRLPRRDFDTHKGKAGRVVIVAGSKGYTGAPILTAMGASHGGAGLVTLCVPEEIYDITAAKTPPEVMVRPISDFDEVAGMNADVFAVGPGLGKHPLPGLINFLTKQPKPVVIDADGLNALADDPDKIAKLPANRLLTPHPGEMARLWRESAEFDRETQARRFADQHGFTLLLKGARTIIASPGRPIEFNSTGHPGMASGGMGDVLTGLCAAWIAQGLDLHDAACIGSWLLGRAAEIACRNGGIAMEAVTSTMVAEHLGAALLALQTPGSP